MEDLEGWIFDAYPEPEGMRLWVIDKDGRARHFLDPWSPCLYVSGTKPELSRAAALLAASPFPVTAQLTERKELFSGSMLPVLQVRVQPMAYAPLAKRLRERNFALHNADIHLVQHYHYERGHFPLARCAFQAEAGKITSWQLKDDPWALDYELPPLRAIHVALSASEVAGKLDPNHAPKGRLLVTEGKITRELEGDMELQLESLEHILKELDPDVITTDWGDSYLLPMLDAQARLLGRKLPFSRDASKEMGTRRERSFMTYGRTVYQGGARYLFGRWHLDVQNSFMLGQTGTDGLFELCRISGIPVQRSARCTIGTSLSSMQMGWAVRQGILIPMDKAQAEDFRPATELLDADKGGLAYEPEVGWHDSVAEYDFVSMYPTMMVRHNISPETVNCACCPDNKVPGVAHHLCKNRRGLVPSVLAPILEKRARYKVLAKAGGPDAAAYKNRAAAHKWTLVCCFGYLGFKNARFGKIEAHECVTAWGREVLLKAKEAVEAKGFHMLHALVDSLWIKVEPGTDLEALRLHVEKEAGCPLALEGLYRWIRFCPSKQDPLSGVPNRYFGAFDNGELKIRGIAFRRRDTPKLLKDLQDKLLRRLAQASDLTACHAALPELSQLVQDCRLRLKEGQATAEELAITFHISQAPESYVHDTLNSIAAKQLAGAGVQLHPGETVRYVITSAKDKVKDWRTMPLALMQGALEYDAKKYLELLERAAEEVLGGIKIERQLTLKMLF